MTDAERLADALGVGALPDGALTASLGKFADLVLKWNASINIIGKSTTEQIWERHVLDSAQLFRCATPDHRLWLDIGSGGGFPGIVIAILAKDRLSSLRVALVESDQRKCVFLSEAARQLGLSVTVHRQRAEALEPQGADVVSARALASLSSLCGYAERHLKPTGVCAFLKGASTQVEIEEARLHWRFEVDQTPSITDSKSTMLFLKDLRRV